MADGGALLFHTRQDQRRSVRSALAHMPTRFERRRPPPSHFLSAGHTTTTGSSTQNITQIIARDGKRKGGGGTELKSKHQPETRSVKTHTCVYGQSSSSVLRLEYLSYFRPFWWFFTFSVTSWLFMPRPKHFDTVWLVKLLKTQRSSVIWINLIPDWDIPLGYTVMF